MRELCDELEMREIAACHTLLQMYLLQLLLLRSHVR